MAGFDKDLHQFKSGEADNLSLGQNGCDLVSNTSAQSGGWVCIQPLEDTVFSSITIKNSAGTFTGRTWTASTPIFGRITAFTLTSGAVLAYRYLDPA